MFDRSTAMDKIANLLIAMKDQEILLADPTLAEHHKKLRSDQAQGESELKLLLKTTAAQKLAQRENSSPTRSTLVALLLGINALEQLLPNITKTTKAGVKCYQLAIQSLAEQNAKLAHFIATLAPDKVTKLCCYFVQCLHCLLHPSLQANITKKVFTLFFQHHLHKLDVKQLRDFFQTEMYLLPKPTKKSLITLLIETDQLAVLGEVMLENRRVIAESQSVNALSSRSTSSVSSTSSQRWGSYFGLKPADAHQPIKGNAFIDMWYQLSNHFDTQHPQSLLPQTWLPLFWYFLDTLKQQGDQFTLDDIAAIFVKFHHHPVLSAQSYFSEFMWRADVSVTPTILVAMYFQGNRAVLDPTSAKVMATTILEKFFARQIDLDTATMIFTAIQKISPRFFDYTLQALAPVVKTVLSNSYDNYDRFFYELDQLLVFLVDGHNADPHQSFEGRNSFFKSLLDSWSHHNEVYETLHRDGFIPHHIKMNVQHLHYYEVRVNESNSLALMTQYVYWSELFSLLRKPDEFAARVKALFGTLFLAEKIDMIRTRLLQNKGMPTPESLGEIQDLIAHKLDTGMSSLPANSPEFFQTLANLTNKKIQFVKRVFDHTSKYHKLQPEEKIVSPQSSNATGGMMVFHKKNAYRPCIYTDTFIDMVADNSAEVEKFKNTLIIQSRLIALVQRLYEKNDFQQPRKVVENLKRLPALICSLNSTARVKLLDCLIKDESEERHIVKLTILFNVLANFDSVKAYGKKDPYPVLRAELSEIFQGRAIVNTTYYRLFMHNISPAFYEDAKNHNARPFIDKFMAEPAFQQLYQAARENQFQVTDLINLLNCELRYRDHFITATTLQLLATLQATLHNPQAQLSIYHIINLFWLTYDVAGKKDSFEADFNLLIRILQRFDTNDKEDLHVLETFSSTVKKEGLEKIQRRMQISHPLLQDLAEMDLTLLPNRAVAEYYLVNLTVRKLKHELALQNPALLAHFIQMAGESDVIARLLTEGSPSIDFKHTSYEGRSWLEYSFSLQLVSLLFIRNLIKNAGVDYATAFLNGISFAENFLNRILAGDISLDNPLTIDILTTIVKDTRPHIRAVILRFIDSALQTSSLTAVKENAELSDVIISIAIQANRFDILRALKMTEKWLQQASFGSWEAEIRQTLAVPSTLVTADMMRLFETPGLYTTHCQMVPQFFRSGDMSVDILLLALNSNLLTAQYDAQKTNDYFNAFVSLQRSTQEWSGIIGLEQLYPATLQAIQHNIQTLTLQDVVDLIQGLLTIHFNDASIKDNIPYVSGKIYATLAQSSPHEWKTAINQLITQVQAFKIAGLPITEVKEAFKNCSPTFKNVINWSAATGNTGFTSKVTQLLTDLTTSVSSHKADPVNDYIFDVVVGVQANLESTYKHTMLTPEEIKQGYETIQPVFSGNLAADIEFFTLLCLASRQTLESGNNCRIESDTHALKITPYHAQLATVIGAAYAMLYPAETFHGNTENNILLQVGTGQGKSLIMALQNACTVKMSLQGQRPANPFIPVITLESNLAERDAKFGKPLYDLLGISSGLGIDKQKTINYGTSWNLVFFVINTLVARIKSDAFLTLAELDWLQGAVLMIDETDVEFYDRINEVVFALQKENEGFPEMDAILIYIWNNRNTDSHSVLTGLTRLPEWSRLAASLQNHVTDYIASFIATAKKVAADPNVTATGVIPQYEATTGITAKNTYGHYAQSQFCALKRNENLTQPYRLPHYALSQKKLLSFFKTKVGYSGTVFAKDGNHNTAVKNYSGVETARFTSVNLRVRNTLLCDTKEAWQERLLLDAWQTYQEGRPVLIFVNTTEDATALHQFFDTNKHRFSLRSSSSSSSSAIVDSITLNLLTDTQRSAALIEAATQARTITIASMINGRGTDFVLNNEEINRAGGLHVVRAFVPVKDAVEIQIDGRTARGFNNGTVQPIYYKQQIISFYEQVRLPGLVPTDINEQNVDTKIACARAAWLHNQEQHATTPQLAEQLSDDFYLNPQILTKRSDHYKLFSTLIHKAMHSRIEQAITQYSQVINPRFQPN